MKKLMLMTSLFFVGVSVAQAQAQEKTRVLDCMETVNIDDPSFQQGSEKYFDVYSTEGKIEVLFTRGDLKTETILPAATQVKGYIDLEDGALHSVWNSGKNVELILRDFGRHWRGMFMFPDGYQSELLQVPANSEIELECKLKI